MLSALRSFLANARTRPGRSTDVDSDEGAALKVLVSGRPPAHLVRYVDQIMGDSSLSGPPRGIEFVHRDTPTGRDAVDVVHLTDSSAVLGDRRVPESEKILRATRFTRAMRRKRVALVRTVNADSANLARTSRAEAILDEAAASHIVLSPHVPRPHGRQTAVIPYSHLRYRFLGYPRGRMQPGRLLMLTSTTFHSGYESPLKVFAYADLPDHTLRIVGRVPSSLMASFTRTISRNRTRISLRNEAISDAARVSEVTEAEMVVVAQPESTESIGTMLLALSLDRPVLVEETPSTRALADEVGDTWVRLHEGPLTVATLEKAVAALKSSPPVGHPDLTDRDPDTIAAQYASVYRAAVAPR